MTWIPFACLGILMPTLAPSLSLGSAIGWTLMAFLLGISWRWRALFWPCLLILLLGWGYTEARIAFRDLSKLSESRLGSTLSLQGTVSEISDEERWGSRFVFEVDLPPKGIPPRILLYDKTHRFAVGSRWQVAVRLKPNHFPINPFGFDKEAWFWSQNIAAYGYVQQAKLLQKSDGFFSIERLRESLLKRIENTLGQTSSSALVAALTIGVQNRIPAHDWQTYSQTGTTHLISISGLHITMLAGLLTWLARFLLGRFKIALAQPLLLSMVIGLLGAWAYAILAGLSIPTQRTVLALSTVVTILCLRRHASDWLPWWSALLVVLVVDPFAGLMAGFWLSFGLIAIFLLVLTPRLGRLKVWRDAIYAQASISLVSAPLLIGFFGAIPLVSPFCNAWAIPFVSWVLTPIALLALILPFEFGLYLADALAAFLIWGLEWFNHWPNWSLRVAPWPVLSLAALGALGVCLPLPRVYRLLSLGLFCSALIYPPLPLRNGQFHARLLDVGQGLSLLVQTQQHQLLFDTGAGKAEQFILPNLKAQGLNKLDALVLSHHDADHDAAAPSLLKAISVKQIYAGQAKVQRFTAQPVADCHQAQRWLWDGVQFEFLEPQWALPPIEDNDYSCVLKITSLHNQQSLLITGDLSMAGELGLIQAYGTHLKSDILVLGHHGSKTSSHTDFIETVRPQIAWIGVGYRNRYRHPHAQVTKRLQQRDIPVWRTDRDGSIDITLGQSKRLQPLSYRQSMPRYWRSPAFGLMPDTKP